MEIADVTDVRALVRYAQKLECIVARYESALQSIAGQADNNWTKGLAETALKDVGG